MTFLTQSAYPATDEKTAILTRPGTAPPTSLHSRFATLRNTASKLGDTVKDFQNTVGDNVSNAGEWLDKLPIDGHVFKELDAWEKNRETHGQMTNAFLKHYATTDMGYKPRLQSVTETGLSEKVPLGHLVKVLDRSIGTELGKELANLDKKTGEWKRFGTSAHPGTKASMDPWPWARNLTPLIGKTIKAINEINEINRKRDKEDSEATTEKGEKGSLEEGSVFSGDSHQSEFAVSVVSVA